MREAFSKRDRRLLFGLCILSPITHFYITSYSFALAARFIPRPQSHLLAVMWLCALALIGAFLAALLLATLAARAIRKRPLALASVIAAATTLATLLTWQGGFFNYPAAFVGGELVAFFLLCWLVAGIAMRTFRNYAHTI